MDYRTAVEPHQGRSHEEAEHAEDQLSPLDDMMAYVTKYARERPDVMIFTCLGIGFILGWKLKPW